MWVCRYRCAACGAERRPVLESLEVEPGQPSGLLARMLGLLGCVASYSLAAEMTGQLLGVKVNAMAVWRAVQRLGEAAARHTEALSPRLLRDVRPAHAQHFPARLSGQHHQLERRPDDVAASLLCPACGPHDPDLVIGENTIPGDFMAGRFGPRSFLMAPYMA